MDVFKKTIHAFMIEKSKKTHSNCSNLVKNYKIIELVNIFTVE